MPRGYPDYQNPVNQVAGRLVDFSGIQTAILELASLDGLGRLVWFDTFHQTLSAWALGAEGTGIAPAIDTSLSEVPPSSVVLDVSVGGPLCTSTLNREILYTNPKTFGIDFSLLYNAGHSAVQVSINRIYHGVQQSMFVLYSPNTGTIQVFGGDGGHTILTLPATITNLLWIPIKLVVDFDNNRGLRMVVLMDSYSLVNIPTVSAVAASTDRINIFIKAVATGAGSVKQYLGHVYLTADEP